MALTILNNTLIEDEAMDGDFTTDAQEVEECTMFSVQMTWTDGSTPVGTFSIECSNDGTNYVELTDANIPVSEDEGSAMINVASPAFQWVRAKYARESGDGTATITISGKRI
jgi:hypothetical protein